MPSKRKIRDLLSRQIPSDTEGALAPHESLGRLIAARDEVTKQSNSLLLASVFFAALYCLKALGLRIDIVIFDYKVFETPYGIFVFCVGSSISFIISISRFMDARIFDRYAKSACEAFWPSNAEYAYNTFPQVNSWFEPTRRSLEQLRNIDKVGIVPYILVQISGIILFFVYCISISISLHFLLNFEALSDASGKSFQYWSVFFLLIFDIAFLISMFSVMGMDMD